MAKKKSFGIDDLLTDQKPNQEIKKVKKSNKKTTALSFDEDFLKKLKHYAVDNDMYMSQVIEEVVGDYISNNKNATSINLKEDFVRKLKHYAVDHSMFVSRVIEEAVEEYIAKK